MKNTFILILLCPLLSLAQSDLTGIWRLKISKNIKGPDYTNGIPSIITIRQQNDSISMDFIFVIAEHNTVSNEKFIYKQFNCDTTASGKNRTTTFLWDSYRSCWLKETSILLREAVARQESIDKQNYNLKNDSTLTLLRVYDGNETLTKNKDFIVEGTYEKVAPELLQKETAIGNGINFDERLTWEQIKTKAKRENKWIFVDCYATWCAPCKLMDRNVYPLDMVGEIMNAKFISVKLQLDTTKNDLGTVQLLYPAARELEKKYSVSALPTYLFFSPDGKIVHKTTGQKSPKEFVKMISDVLIPEKQLYTLVENAKNKKIPIEQYPQLAKRLKNEFGEKELAHTIAKLYKERYIDKLEETALLQKKHLDFLYEYYQLINSKDRIFSIAFKNPNVPDSITGYEWAEERVVKSTIIKENILPFVSAAQKSNREPDWAKLENRVAKSYNKNLAASYATDARVDWYHKIKNWDLYLKWLPVALGNRDLDKMHPVDLHKALWQVFLYSSDSTLLKQALEWMDIVLKNWHKTGWLPDGPMDTKASLLYKSGRKEEAIELEKKVLLLYPQFAYAYQPRLDQMLRNEKLWETGE